MTTERMIVGMDLSDAAIKAAKWASECFAPNAEMILVHVIEPPDLWVSRLPAKYQDEAPRVITESDGQQFWLYDGKKRTPNDRSPSHSG